MFDLVLELESLWKSLDSPPDVFEFLNEASAFSAEDVLPVLLADQRIRWKSESPLKVEDYLDRLPALAADPKVKLQLAVGEFEARQACETAPNIDDYTSRFGDLGDTLRERLLQFRQNRSPEPGEEAVDPDEPRREPALRSIATGTELFTPSKAGELADLGRYQLENVLGEGTFGRVYLAFDFELHRPVAIKVPTPERFQEPGDAEQYLREARTVARLNHPHIVPVHDVGRTDDGSIYVVSRFIDGWTLQERLKQGRPDFEESANHLSALGRALQHAHDQHVIHLDVKPGNILLERETNMAFIADFGLAIRQDDIRRHGDLGGTPAYMSPEQARGEGHRLDGRSDIFSLGVVLYEMLTGRKPFRGSTANELLHQVVSVDPSAPRELEESIPVELERICLKALSKRASDRYGTAAELADDLQNWNQSPQCDQQEHQLVPKGLRSFDADDADFFLDLLPGPRNRAGLPESIQFWKTRIEETDPERTFSVGLLYGPSGCGKSSLVKAGLLSRLSNGVTAIYVEATPDETEIRVLRGLRKLLPELPQDLGLVETFSLLRRGKGSKVVIVLDQFEQWLHTHRSEMDTELVAALRQCDGGSLQTVVMVRDDFWMAASRFMSDVEVEIVQGVNVAAVDLFSVKHARKILQAFGRAYGDLDACPNLDNDAFVEQTVLGLSQDGKVVSVQLSLFAEMVKGKPWVPATLEEVGGTEGIGVNFLEETFSSRTANPEHRLHEQAAREVLKALLPEVGSDIKGHMRSHSELLEASGYASRSGDFRGLLRILDGELRLITPTDPAGFQSESGRDPSSKFYQLTHDYLVPSLREWLTRKQTESRKGRAELKLAERSALWNAKPETRHLPSLLEWASIRILTEKKKWDEPQRKMMSMAGQRHRIRSGLVLAGLMILIFAGVTIQQQIDQDKQRLVAQKEKERRAGEATRLVESLVSAETGQVGRIIREKLIVFRNESQELLQKVFTESTADSNAKLHAALALLPDDKSVLPYLQDSLLRVTPMQFGPVRDLLKDDQAALVAAYWETARTGETPELRFQAACALASFDSRNKDWQDEGFQTFIAGHLVSVRPSELLPWTNALRPVKDSLTDALKTIYVDSNAGEQERSFATDTLADYWSANPDELFDLLANANLKQFGPIFKKLDRHRKQAVRLGNAEVAAGFAEGASETEKEALAMRQANGAVMLLRMDAADQVWPLLRHSPDPRVRSYIIHQLSARGGDATTIINRYEQETDVTIKRALLLCLGEFELGDSVKQPLIEELLEVYRSDPDAGLHAAAEWLLRRWKQSDRLAAIDKDLRQKEDELAAAKDQKRQWYVNSQEQTFVILDAGEFQMGSPETEDSHDANERLHRRKIGRRIAIANKEVTREQWRRFSLITRVWDADQDGLKQFIRSDDSPIVGMTWFEAAHYCNWLSEQEGIPEEQWCYEKNGKDEYGPGMKAKDNCLELTGYRLPTEAEWEFACRAGTSSSRYYGVTDALLHHYAWYQTNGEERTHPVASLKPNDFGLFDMQGNVYEWCFDEYVSTYAAPKQEEAVIDVPNVASVEITRKFVLRGGSFGDLPSNVRSASRHFNPPDYRSSDFVFRPARTCNSSP